MKTPEPIFHLWTMCLDPLTDWHVIDGNDNLSFEEATRREKLGNQHATEYSVNILYMMFPTGSRPIEPSGLPTYHRSSITGGKK